MLRIEAYNVLDGLAVRLIGTCGTAHGWEGRCEGFSAGSVVTSSTVEEKGLGGALREAVDQTLRDFPDIVEYVLH